jgi:hypothetical protein
MSDDTLRPSEERAAKDRVERLARWLDDGLTVPGTSIRIGLDPLLGMIPGIGDFVTTFLGIGILVEARRLKAPASILALMALNLGLDLTIGLVPVLGDFADFFFRANRKNARLFREWYDDPRQAHAQARRHLALRGALLLGTATLVVVLLTGLLSALFRLASA